MNGDYLPAEDTSLNDALVSAVIEAYERALDQGLAPFAALSVILNWVAQECERICERKSGGEPE